MKAATQIMYTEDKMKSYKHFTLKERICLEVFLKSGKIFSEIAEPIGRNKSTISREAAKNSSAGRV